MASPFTVLGVAENADDAAIKKAYLRQVREHPPERDPERFQTIRAAYEAIKTHQDRLRHRLFGQEAPELADLVASALQPGPRGRLSEQHFRHLLLWRLSGQK